MGRNSLWLPHVLTFSERLKGEMMRLRYTSTANKSITKRYRLFCNINGTIHCGIFARWNGHTLNSFVGESLRWSRSSVRSRHVMVPFRAVIRMRVYGQMHSLGVRIEN